MHVNSLLAGLKRNLVASCTQLRYLIFSWLGVGVVNKINFAFHYCWFSFIFGIGIDFGFSLFDHVGTIEERGLLYWKNMRRSTERSHSSRYLTERLSATYDLPFMETVLSRFRILRNLPFCHTYAGNEAAESSRCCFRNAAGCCVSRQKATQQNHLADDS